MITWIDKRASIFDSSAQVLVNPVNCDGIMGAGLALEFKRRFPDMFSSYKCACIRGDLRIGKLHFWDDDALCHAVLNFPTKNHLRDHSSLAYIRAGLIEFVCRHAVIQITSIAFPLLGCGLGGLNRDQVRALMSEYLGPLEGLSVEIYLR